MKMMYWCLGLTWAGQGNHYNKSSMWFLKGKERQTTPSELLLSRLNILMTSPSCTLKAWEWPERCIIMWVIAMRCITIITTTITITLILINVYLCSSVMFISDLTLLASSSNLWCEKRDIISNITWKSQKAPEVFTVGVDINSSFTHVQISNILMITDILLTKTFSISWFFKHPSAKFSKQLSLEANNMQTILFLA